MSKDNHQNSGNAAQGTGGAYKTVRRREDTEAFVGTGEVIKKEIKRGSSQIFDNAFLSGCAWHKRLLIPLINVLFHKNIPERMEIEHAPNELFSHQKDKEGKDRLTKRNTDALVIEEGNRYHFECESKNDGRILIRIGGYDLQIALDGAGYSSHRAVMELPETAVVFLRNHKGLPDHGEIVYKKGGQSLSHQIPYFKIGEYSLEFLTEKHLYILFPFYLMRYEHAIKNNTEKKFEKIEREAEKVYNVLTSANREGILTDREYENIMILCSDVIKEMGKGSKIKERLVNVMGTEVLLTAEERGIEKGMEKGIEKGEDQMLSAINLINSGYKTVQELVTRGISQRTAEKAVGSYCKPM